MENEKTELKMIRMSEIEAQEIKWLWYPFIPYGKLTIVQGDPGDGKTTMILNLAAQLTKGKGFEEGSGVDAPLKMIYQTAWKENGEVAGLVEISMVIPEDMPHYVR